MAKSSVQLLKEEFGAELRRLRKAANLTQEALAGRAGYHRVSITQVEKGRQAFGSQFVARVEAALDAKGRLHAIYQQIDASRCEQRLQASLRVGQLSKYDSSVSTVLPLEDQRLGQIEIVGGQSSADRLAGPVRVPISIGGSEICTVTLDCQAFLAVFGALAFPTPPFTALRPSHTASKLDVSEVIEHFRCSFKSYVHGDRVLGPKHLLLPVTGVLATIEQLMARVHAPARRKLLALGTRFAEFGGWILQDAGHRNQALYWSDRAMEWAQESHNDSMVAYILMRKSNQASDARDAARVVGLAKAARGVQGPLNDQIQALALRQEAHGYALRGEERPCHRALDLSLELAARGEKHGDEGPGGYCTQTYVEFHRAHCWVEFEKPARAIPVFEAALATWPGEQQRDRGLVLSRLALAYADMQCPERASENAREALSLAHVTGSGRIASDLRLLYDKLARWQYEPAVAPLYRTLARLLGSRVDP